ncbi:MAG: chemotaxis response regulator protein-glutamate methylesterase [Proteobacteria bacterium]|nr:MAG: chemotaxis response regulator protein-glutamate methylesterase [Pseudomonadota bacterium]
MTVRPVRVLIVDDSALVRVALSRILAAQPDIEVVGTAMDPFVARDKIAELKPDVLTLDIEMPRMDGVTFLRKLMRHKPTPVVMVSSLTSKGADATLEALAAGAVDYIAKPNGSKGFNLDAIADEIVVKVRAAAAARLAPVRHGIEAKRPAADADRATDVRAVMRGAPAIICIGASTGGTTAIETVLRDLPRAMPPIVIVQHMPEAFTGSFARRVDSLCQLEVLEASHRLPVQQGRAVIAHGGAHMVLQRGKGGYYVDLKSAPPVNRHRPSVDVLFRSAVNAAGPGAIGVLLTGMGADGARGLLELRKAGAMTVAQDEASSVVWGMPRVAIELGGAEQVLPLDKVAGFLLKQTRGGKR